MKKFYTLLFLIPLTGNSQTVTSVAAGNFYSPATWDCTCIPNDTDTIYINHAVTMDFGGIVYSGGLLQIGGAGSLLDGGADNGILIDGGNVTNIGMINCGGLLLESGYLNNLSQLYVDSLWTRDTVSNMGIIAITGSFRNDLDGHFTNWGDVNVGNDFLNEAVFINNSDMVVHHDFSNCNLATSEATFDISGTLCVYNDFSNCVDDTILGNGTITIAGTSSNAGELMGNFIIRTPTGALTSNTGNIEPGISFTTGACDGGFTDENLSWRIYPNPAKNFVISTETNIRYEIYDFSGRLICSDYSEDGMIGVESLAPGVYVIRMLNADGRSSSAIMDKY
jgi:hypothetical protein